MEIRVDTTRATPPSRQIVEAVLERIAAGLLGPGDKLPSARKLAAEALVNPNTVGKAYRDLEAMGAVAGRSGAGVFVTEEGPATARADRRSASLDAVQVAIETAVRVGLNPDRLSGRIEKWLSGAVTARDRYRLRCSQHDARSSGTESEVPARAVESCNG